GRGGAALGQRRQRRAEAGLAEDHRVDAPGELAQLGDGQPQLLGRLVERRRQLPVGAGRDLRAGDPEGERQIHQPLLGAVVQVALDPAALGVAELDDAGPGGADLLELGPDLGLEALVLDRQAGGGGDRLDQLGLVVEGCVGGQGGDGCAGRGRGRGGAPAGAGGGWWWGAGSWARAATVSRSWRRIVPLRPPPAGGSSTGRAAS